MPAEEHISVTICLKLHLPLHYNLIAKVHTHLQHVHFL